MLTVALAGWAGTLALVAGLFALDLFVSARSATASTFRAALGWSGFYVLVALLFGIVLALSAGGGVGAQYFAGYLVEKSLSVDNLFVLAVVLATFAVPRELQSRALVIGIALALLLRGALIAAGAALIAAFSIMFLLFGLALLLTAVQLVRQRGKPPAVESNAVVRLARRVVPLSDSYQGARIVVRADGRRVFTPLFVVLLAIATTDLLFAFDSIPAVFGVTQHPYVVFTANAFALLGMRALYFLVVGLLDRLVYLSLGLATILAFIGVKLILHFLHGEVHAVPEISTGASVAVIALVLLITTLASLLRPRRDPSARAQSAPSQIHASPHWPDEPGARSCVRQRA